MSDPDAFRAALRRLAASVAIVTTGRGETAAGMTATAVTSICLEPPSLLVCVNRGASLYPALISGVRFRVTWLADHQGEVARAFGGAAPRDSRFTWGDWRMEAEGGPALNEAVAASVCRLARAVDHGTHTLFIGEVEMTEAGLGRPLLYCDGTFGGLAA